LQEITERQWGNIDYRMTWLERQSIEDPCDAIDEYVRLVELWGEAPSIEYIRKQKIKESVEEFMRKLPREYLGPGEP